MSLLQSAKLYGHDPWAYLKDVLTFDHLVSYELKRFVNSHHASSYASSSIALVGA